MKKYLLICIQYYLFTGTVLLLSSCAYDTVVEPEPEIPEEVSFGLNVMPIFDAKCSTTGCHDQGGIPPVLTSDVAWSNLINFNYVNTQDPPTSLLYEKIDEGGSMETFASNTDRAMILAWIEQGALDN
ncbi:MAG: hypothetical protein JXR07_08130 [Reichenbachiella sp.]